MGDIVDLDTRRPHCCVCCPDGHVHVLPVAWLLDVAAGSALMPLPDCLLRRIVTEWLACIRAGVVEAACRGLEADLPEDPGPVGA